MEKTCIACGNKAKVTMMLPDNENSEYGALPAIAPKSFCLWCMHEISKAYNNLHSNNFAGIAMGDD